MTNGLRIERRFTKPGQDPYRTLNWTKRDSRITNPDGSVVFEMENAEVPEHWSQVATDIIVSKYFRKAGVPQVDEHGVAQRDDNGQPVLGSETSARQVFDRLAGTWRHWGEQNGYFASAGDASAFEDELRYMLANQIGSPNSPQWFNTGLNWAYGLTGPPQGFWYVDPEQEEAVPSPDSYSRPTPHACYILGVDDDLVNPGGIMDLWMREARIFKFGSGVGENFSMIRAEGEPLSGGGKSSGLMSFLKIGDRAAGAIKCLHETAEIPTDRGLLPIRDVRAGDRVLTSSGYERVSAVHDNGTRALVKVTTVVGDQLLCTPEHRFWVRTPKGEGWREAGRLGDDDYVTLDLSGSFEGARQELRPVQQRHHNEIQHELPESLDEAIALWLGWIYGDGSITSRPSTKFIAVQIGDEDPELIGRYRSLVTSVFGSRAHTYVNRRGDGRVDRSASVRFASSLVIRFLELNGLRKARSHDVAIPQLVKSSPRTVRAAFVSGLFEADGHVDNGYPVLSTVSKQLALDVHRLLLTLGIPSTIKEQTNRRGAIGNSPIFLVRVVSGVGVARFSKLVGFISERKSRLLSEAARRKALSPYETQWILPHAENALNELWNSATGKLRRALGPYCRYQVPRSMSLLRARRLVKQFPDELTNTVLGSFARGERMYVRALVSPAEAAPVYDLTVDEVHEYLVHNLVTHNSGGTTRRAAKMVILDIDHPDIEAFIDWKKVEEDKARLLIEHGGFPADFNGEAYQTVSGQNSNNSVRVANDFIAAVIQDEDWDLIERTTGNVRKTVKSRDLWRRIADAAWACADPGVQFDTTINEWHTSPAGGRIRASNPCSEYLFVDNTACNLASLNLGAFYDDQTGDFDIEAYRHAIRLWTIVLEISVTMAHFPSKAVAEGSYDYRTLGLGYANLGSLLMRSGIPYDSDEGRAIAGCLTAILTGESYATSAEMAAALGPFPKFPENREAMLRVMRNHRRAAYDALLSDYEGISHNVVGIDEEAAPESLLKAAREAWDRAVELGERYGYRNAQSTVTAPTGTIGLQMDCDTTGVEPDFSLVKFKKLAGGGYFKIVNQSVAPALARLGYAAEQIDDILDYLVGTMTLLGAPHVNRKSLTELGFTPDDLRKVEESLPGTFELKHAFSVFVLGSEALERLGFKEEQYASFDFDLLRELGFTAEQIREATDVVCGRQTIEGAPYLKEEHLAIFDCANRNGRYGRRFIHHSGHIKMMSVVQPLISGSISKTINMPADVTPTDIEESYMLSWELGLKSMALYRDGSKASQVLHSTADESDSLEEQDSIDSALEPQRALAWGEIPAGISPTQAYASGMQPPRFLLPARRGGWTQEARIGGHKVFLRTGQYDDGTLGEVFIDLAKEGATLRGVLSCFAIAISKGLQFGVPLEEFIDTFTFQTFEPRGLVEGHPNIRMANSIIDYVFRALALEYQGRDDLVQVPPQEGEFPEPPSGLAIDAGMQLDLTDAAMETDIEAQQQAASFVDAGSGNGARAADPPPEHVPAVTAAMAFDTGIASAQRALAEMMGDAPLCDVCGHITVRNGSCFKCLNCGHSLGCS